MPIRTSNSMQDSVSLSLSYNKENHLKSRLQQLLQGIWSKKNSSIAKKLKAWPLNKQCKRLNEAKWNRARLTLTLIPQRTQKKIRKNSRKKINQTKPTNKQIETRRDRLQIEFSGNNNNKKATVISSCIKRSTCCCPVVVVFVVVVKHVVCNSRRALSLRAVSEQSTQSAELRPQSQLGISLQKKTTTKTATTTTSESQSSSRVFSVVKSSLLCLLVFVSVSSQVAICSSRSLDLSYLSSLVAFVDIS